MDTSMDLNSFSYTIEEARTSLLVSLPFKQLIIMQSS